MRLLAAVLVAAAGAAAGADHYSAALFVHALRNTTSAPEYVLFTLRSAGQPDRVVCTEAPFLLAAIRTELGLGSDTRSDRTVQEFAESRSETRLFALERPRAVLNVQPRYTGEILAEVRGELSSLSREQLATALRSPNSPVHGLYKGKHGQEWAAHRDAVAHVLLEHGVPVGRGDPVGDLHLAGQKQD